MTRGRYIPEGYLYFLSHYSRSYQKLFSEKSLMTRRRLHILLTPLFRDFPVNFFAVNYPISSIYTVEQSLEVIISIYHFKRDNHCFLYENDIFESNTCMQNGQYFERSLDLTSCEYDVRRVERLGPPSLPDENAEDC